MQQKFNSHIYKGFVIAIVYIIFNTIITFLKLPNAHWADFVAWFIIIGGSIISVYFFGKINNYNQSFAALFSHGFKTIAVATCLIFIYVLLMIYFINSSQIIANAELATINAQKQGYVNNHKEILDFKANFIKVNRLMSIALTIMGTLFLGLIGSAIGAVATSKKNIQTN